MKLGILGGGMSALSLAYLYQGESEILEKDEQIGGHSRSHEKFGFIYDEGGHILFSRDESLLQQMVQILGDNVLRLRRNNKVWYKRRFVKYPFENGLSALDKEDIFECLYHYLNNDAPEPTNFREWVHYTFGKGIADRYLIPYNEKIWKTDLSQMALEWVGRVPRPAVADVIKSALGIETEGYVHQLYFYYPLAGGFEALPRALAAASASKCRITTDFAVTSIRQRGTDWVVSDGSTERRFDRLVSTLPLAALLATLPSVPSDVMDAFRRLRYLPSVFVLVGLNDCLAKDVTAVYFPQRDVLFTRVCFTHTFSPHVVPEGKFAALAEITCDPEDAVWTGTDEAVCQRVVDDLVREGFFRPEDVVVTDVHRSAYSYVVNTLNSRESYETVRSFVNGQGIELLGRFAEFQYWNTDQIFARAITLAAQLNTERTSEGVG